MTTRAKNANLSPKGTNAPAKTAPKASSFDRVVEDTLKAQMKR